MTDLATRPATTWPAADTSWDGTIDRLPANRPLSQGERMREWLHLFKECREAAEILSRTSFVPKEMQGKPAEAAVSMMKGWELGLDPLDALASIFVVHGRVGFYAEFMRRRVIQAGHTFRVVESTDNRCVVEGTRSETGETHRAMFSEAQAKRAKIDIQTYPADKLLARATSRLVKQAFPDVLSGSLIVEDLLDGIVAVDSERLDQPAEQQTAAAPVQRRRAPRAVKAPARPAPAVAVDDDLLDDAPEPASETPPKPDTPQVAEDTPSDDLLDDDAQTEPYTTPQDNEPEPPPSSAQNRKMHALFREAGIEDRKQRLAVTGAIVGQVLTSSSQLVASEASYLIDTFERWKENDALQTEIAAIIASTTSTDTEGN